MPPPPPLKHKKDKKGAQNDKIEFEFCFSRDVLFINAWIHDFITVAAIHSCFTK